MISKLVANLISMATSKWINSLSQPLSIFSLVIHCELERFDNPASYAVKILAIFQATRQVSYEAYKEGVGTDVIIQADGKEFKVSLCRFGFWCRRHVFRFQAWFWLLNPKCSSVCFLEAQKRPPQRQSKLRRSLHNPWNHSSVIFIWTPSRTMIQSRSCLNSVENTWSRIWGCVWFRYSF